MRKKITNRVIPQCGDIAICESTGTGYRVIYSSEQLNTVHLCILFEEKQNADGSSEEISFTKFKVLAYSYQDMCKEIRQENILLYSDKAPVLNIDKLSKKQREQFQIKKDFAEQVADAYQYDFRQFGHPIEKPEYQKLLEKFQMSKRTAYRIITTYVRSGFNEASLLDKRFSALGKRQRNAAIYRCKPGRKGIAGKPITEQDKHKMDVGIKYYLSSSKISVRKACIYMWIQEYHLPSIDPGRISIEDLDRVEAILVPITQRPSLRQFQYYLKHHLTQEQIDKHRLGLNEQRNNLRSLTGDTVRDAFGPCDVVEIDACELDIALVSLFDRTKPVGRPILYTMIDDYSKMIMAVYVSFENNAFTGLSGLFLNLAENKKDLLAKYGIQKNEQDIVWPTGYVPRRARCDRGADFLSASFQTFCQRRNITREAVPGATGSYKGNVEQFFHRVHAVQNALVDGNGLITKDPMSRHHQQAVMTIDEYMALLLREVIRFNTKYMQSYPITKDMRDRGVHPYPLEIWNYGIVCGLYGRPKQIGSYEQYCYDLMVSGQASINRRGLTFEGLHYLPEGRLLSELIYAKKAKKLSVRYDPKDVSILWFKDEQGYLHHADLNQGMTRDNSYAGLSWAEYRSYRSLEKEEQQIVSEHEENADAILDLQGQKIVQTAKAQKPSKLNNTKGIAKNRAKERHALLNRDHMSDTMSKDSATVNEQPDLSVTLPNHQSDNTSSADSDNREYPDTWSEEDEEKAYQDYLDL